MTLDEYQRRAHDTAVYPARHSLPYLTLGLTGEAGEIANKVKKVIRDSLPIESVRLDLALEAGDTLWYLSELAAKLGYTLSQIAEMNLNKLAERKRTNTIKGSGDERSNNTGTSGSGQQQAAEEKRFTGSTD